MPVIYTQPSASASAAENAIKMQVRAGTTGAIAMLAGGAPNVVDGVALAVGDRILVKNQADPKQNGIYTVSVVGTGADGTWIRATDFDQDAEVKAGVLVVITEGATQADTVWELATDDPIMVGVSNLNFIQIGGSGVITGSGTPPRLAFFSALNQISDTPHAEHRTNDIFFNNGIAFNGRGSTVSTNITVTDIYVGGLFRLTPITFTLPALASVEDGHLYIFGDETGQGATLPVIIAAQVGEIIREGGFNNASISTFLPHQFYKLIKRPTYYMVIGD